MREKAWISSQLSKWKTLRWKFYTRKPSLRRQTFGNKAAFLWCGIDVLIFQQRIQKRASVYLSARAVLIGRLVDCILVLSRILLPCMYSTTPSDDCWEWNWAKINYLRDEYDGGRVCIGNKPTLPCYILITNMSSSLFLSTVSDLPWCRCLNGPLNIFSILVPQERWMLLSSENIHPLGCKRVF